jgi:hypothetical protein
MSRHLVIGHLGQIGSAVHRYLAEHHEVSGLDTQSQDTPTSYFDALHVCIPYSLSFTVTVSELQSKYLTENGLTIIHSTVPVGTTDTLNSVHSPMRGIHPNLYQGLLTFTKYFGGPRADEAAQYFSTLTTQTISNAKTTEAAKLWDTTAYGLMIVLEKEIHTYCEQHNLDFNIVYTQFTETYNQGYTALGMPHVARPVLKHVTGPIGGHCVIPNLELLGTNTITTFIKDRNSALCSNQFHTIP